jgi:DNA-directed RNA polymerase sigma subunit (sigma70/sigma32)
VFFGEERIIRQRFGIDDDTPYKLRNIGRQLRISRERVRQIEKKAMEKVAQFSSNQIFSHIVYR